MDRPEDDRAGGTDAEVERRGRLGDGAAEREAASVCVLQRRKRVLYATVWFGRTSHRLPPTLETLDLALRAEPRRGGRRGGGVAAGEARIHADAAKMAMERPRSATRCRKRSTRCAASTTS